MLFNILLIASLLYITNSTLHYVISEKQHYVAANNCAHLQHYLDNQKKYFTSHVQLYFLSGEHYLNTDLTLKDVSNFTITGVNFTITCTSPSSVTVVIVTDLKLQNIILANCGKG